MVFAIEPLGYESSSLNVKTANGMIQAWNNSKLKKAVKNSLINRNMILV